MAELVSDLIPRYFHFVFGLKKQCEEFHIAHYLCLQSCLQVNQPDKIFFYYCYEPYGRYWELIADKLELVKVDFVPKVKDFIYADKYIEQNFIYAHHSDFIRVKNLNDIGGVYADMDTLFVNPIPSRLYKESFVMGRERPIECKTTGDSFPSLCNALMMARPGSDFGSYYYQAMHEVFDGSWSKHSCLLANQLSEVYPDLIHIEPERSFYKHPWTKQGIETLLLGRDFDYQDVYSFHLWAHLWWDKKRKDFSRFHSGRLTEEFIRKVDTTYNLIARKYLPERKRSFYFSIPLLNRRREAISN